ncbi:glycogen synthase [Stomatohabitans albus]|uniref:glycogen synthase n=1 Tax=Stomatohabitans albus TaxID=3110766 RepID=UPI00300D6FE0
MKTALLTKEWPPAIYGGAGVHVDFLVRELRQLIDVDVHCFGEPRDDATAHIHPKELDQANAALQTLAVDLAMVDGIRDAELVHTHTWYTNMGGHWAHLLYDIPTVITAHSLEPRRPWKAEQLGGGYRISSWAERTAYESATRIIAVSAGMRADILDCYPQLDPDKVAVVLNGIDTELYKPTDGQADLERLGLDPTRPVVTFVGRITRQKGVPHLLNAARDFDSNAQLLLCAGAADTPELAAQIDAQIQGLQAERDGVVWISEMMDRPTMVRLLSASSVFVCPSIYEPLGIVNLEAMACGVPVVASDVGGIPEVVVDSETGLLAHYTEADPRAFEADLVSGVNRLLADPDLATQFGEAGRQRAVDQFSWASIAEQTVAVYQSALEA